MKASDTADIKPRELVQRFVRASHDLAQSERRAAFDRWIDLADENFEKKLKFPAAEYALAGRDEDLLLEAERIVAELFSHMPSMKTAFRRHGQSVHVGILARRFERRFGRQPSFRQDNVHYLDLSRAFEEHIVASKDKKGPDATIFIKDPLIEIFEDILTLAPEFPKEVPQKLVEDTIRVIVALDINLDFIRRCGWFADALNRMRIPQWFYKNENERIRQFAEHIASNRDTELTAAVLEASENWATWPSERKLEFLSGYTKKFAPFFGSSDNVILKLRPRGDGYAARHFVKKEMPYQSQIEISTKRNASDFDGDFWDFMVYFNHELAHDIQFLRIINSGPQPKEMIPLRFIFTINSSHYNEIEEGTKRYRRQPLERHAYWFGSMMTTKLKRAVRSFKRKSGKGVLKLSENAVNAKIK